jgi:C1A family cysteine protease
MLRTPEGFGLGWLPDYPDFRDHTTEHGPAPEGEQKDTPTLLHEVGADKAAAPAALDTSVTLRQYFSPIEDQGALGSCTANAGAGILEYFEMRAFGNHIDASRLFLYKATRNLMGVTGDTGAFLRTTMQAMVSFGLPPEQYWPYDIQSFDVEPTAFCYSFAQDYRTLRYYRLDPPGTDPEDLLARIKTDLAAGLPAMFGFVVYSSYSQANRNGGAFPYPAPGEHKMGGHAIVAAGFDDEKVIKNEPNGPETTGALLIRNSWGADWGDGGYGWLPYDYVTHQLATDWWGLIKAKWINSGQFGQG